MSEGGAEVVVIPVPPPVEPVATQRKRFRTIVTGFETGRTSLIKAFVTGKCPRLTSSTRNDTYYQCIHSLHDDQRVIVDIVEFANTNDIDRVRYHSDEQANVAIICFALNSPESASLVTTQFYPEINYRYPKIPVVLAGTKLDVREKDSAPGSCLLFQDGLELARSIGAVSYVECSAKSYKGVKQVFSQAFLASQAFKNDKNACSLM
mmetsp:Transcript_7745/g.9588  ORF Transcript_7745/g.9588 Transcript_7745/m.9588 type:complete len:207 (-) Transcript_7745:8-628(-)